MTDFIIINTADELLAIKDMNANYRLGADIDLKGKKLAPIGSEKQPFKGTFDGDMHVISNVTIDASKCDYVGFFGVNEGTCYDIYISSLSFKLEASKDMIVGALAGVNNGSICNMHVSGGAININCANKKATLTFGGAVGENTDELRNCSAKSDVTISSSGMKVRCGGVCGAAHYGMIETVEIGGKYTLNGENILAATIICDAKNVITRANIFASPMNLLNGKVYTDMFISTDEDVVHDGNMWRDNRNDDMFLPKNELALRKKVVDHMRKMATAKWTPNVTLDYQHDKNIAKRVYVAGEQQVGMPYGENNRSYEQFLDCFNEDGTLKPFVKQGGFNGPEYYMGTTCTGSCFYALSRVSDEIDFASVYEILPINKTGLVSYDNVDMMFEGADNTDAICERCDSKDECYDEDDVDLYEDLYKNIHIGDILVYLNKSGKGHTRLCTGSPIIIRNEKGRIQPVKSSVRVISQGDTLGVDYGGDLKSRGMEQPNPSKSWRTDFLYSFKNLFAKNYVTLTLPIYKEGKMHAEEISFTAKDKAPAINGTVASNYHIISVQEIITSKKTKKVVFDQKIYTTDKAYSYTNGGWNNVKRFSVRSFELSEFAPYYAGAMLTKGEYELEVKLTLSTGNTFTAGVKEFTI